MTLQQKLDARREAGQANYGEETAALMARGIRELRESGILETALRVSQKAPDFSLANQHGEIIRAGDLLAKGPLVLTFYRGVW
jgi:hypothetical protein